MDQTAVPVRGTPVRGWRRWRNRAVVALVLAVVVGGSVVWQWSADRPALASSDSPSVNVTLGFGGMQPGDRFYLLGPQLRNDSGDPVTVLSVTATPTGPGARNVGWLMDRVTEKVWAAFDPAADARGDGRAVRITDVTREARTLAPHTDYPNVYVYLAYVVDQPGAYKAERVTVTYLQHGLLRRAYYSIGYRFGTADATPLP